MEVDARGLKCPMPIVKLTKASKQSAVGDQLTVTSDDPAFEPDVRAWCRKTGNTLVELQASGGVIRAVIKKER